VPVSHGSSDAFSTGSHAQYPPHPSTSYDHHDPNTMPAVRHAHANNVHRRVSTSQPSPNRPVANAPTANANGTVNPT
jgi:hypothetical protein